ncbi:hypothetical protein LIER_12389 [Lithospermum erythrorhizon]|uniref:Reverse transcriptase domain-containing protein n=1 Tax=Lithospermum erythrorhizon TaxID=34254 RepID=A0AAV3PTH2_LITER
MPFGLKNAGATYQRAMQKIFDDMLHKKVECDVDDLMVKSVKRKYHPKPAGKFLGFVVRRHGIEIEQAKIDTIVALAEPRNIHELKSLQAFQDIKSYLMSPPVLVAPIQGKPLILYITA